MSGLLVLGAFGFAAALQAQVPSGEVDARWQAWLGCWRPVDPTLNSQTSNVCVVPASPNSAVDVVSVAGAREVSRQRLDATAERRPVVRDGCDGWESTQWSSDKRRAYLRSELTCPGALQRISTGVLAVTPEGELLDIQHVSAGGGTGLRVNRYRDAGIPAELPDEIGNALAGRATAVNAARVAAGAAITPSDVVEASRLVDEPVLQALLVERGQPFQISARQLVSLANAGVPGKVTDVMVALSYPHRFVLDRMSPEPGLRADSTRSTGAYGGTSMRPGYLGRIGCSALGWGFDPWAFDPWGYNSYWPGYSVYGLSPRCGLYGYSPYGYRSYRYGGWYFNRSPYVIVAQGNRSVTPRGQAVNGRGYARRTTGSTASGTATSVRAGTGTSVRAAGGASARSSGRSASGRSGGSGRTAKGRP